MKTTRRARTRSRSQRGRGRPEPQLKKRTYCFAEIERAQSGRDGFEDAVSRIGWSEQQLGLADLGQFTATAPQWA